MLFYRASQAAPGSSAPPSPGPTDTQSVGSTSLSRAAPQNKAWALKSLATGVSILGLAYCLVQALQVAGVQYLATLTSVSLLAFLLVYLVWCATSRRRHQTHGVESGVDCDYPMGAGAGVAPRGHALPSCSSAVELHDAALLRSLAAAGVYVGPPDLKRPPTPPPTYEEAVRAAASASIASAQQPPPHFRLLQHGEPPPPPPSSPPPPLSPR